MSRLPNFLNFNFFRQVKINSYTTSNAETMPTIKNMKINDDPTLSEISKNFNEVSTAATKAGAVLTVAGSLLYTNSIRENSEIQRAAKKSIDEACDSSFNTYN